MNKITIIEILAKEKYVERSITWRIDENDKSDLCQIVYLSLLTMNERKFMDLYKRNKLSNYIMSMLSIQFTSNNSKFNQQVIRFRRRSEEIKKDYLYE